MFTSVISAEDVRGLRMNTFGDGIFHTVTWLAVLVGLGLLYSRVTGNYRQVWSSATLWGWMLHGWGWFNLVEGLVDHQILAIHHVLPGPNQLLWDMLFLVLGVILIVAGQMIQLNASPITSTPRGQPMLCWTLYGPSMAVPLLLRGVFVAFYVV